MAQRMGMTALRRAMTSRPNSVFFTPNNIGKAVLTSQLSTSPARPTPSTEPITPSSATAILAAQRLRRPVSPHLSAYALDQTWFGGSAWMRITGAGLSGALYVFAAAYLVAPLAGWHLESASLAAAFGGLPGAVKAGAKFLVAWPFVFHAVNGVRHLLYDVGYGYAKATIVRMGWVIWGVSAVGALGLVAFL